MFEFNSMQTSREKITYALCWTARIWGLLILIITALAIISQILSADTQSGTIPPTEYLIPTSIFVSVLGLGVAWIWKLAGALINLGFFILNVIIYWMIYGRFLPMPIILVLSPIYIPGILFLVCWYLSRNNQTNANPSATSLL